MLVESCHILNIVMLVESCHNFTNLSEMNRLVTKLLRANNSEDLYNFLQWNQIHCGELQSTFDFDFRGQSIPKQWHFSIDDDNQNIFQPQEWAAYRPSLQDDKYIYLSLSVAQSVSEMI